MIVADLFHPARSGAGALYSAEHFGAVRERLAVPPTLEVQVRPPGVRPLVLRIEADRLVEIGEGLFVPPEPLVGFAAIAIGGAVSGTDAKRFVDVAHRAVHIRPVR